jgi:hypothetical protein
MEYVDEPIPVVAVTLYYSTDAGTFFLFSIFCVHPRPRHGTSG